MKDYTFVIDVDGTLCPIKKEGESYETLPCYAHVRDKIISLKQKGARIVLYSSRNVRTYDNDIEKIERYTRPILEDWLARNSIPYDELILGKPWAGPKGYYVDDKALLPSQFGQWEPTTLIVPICGRSSRYPVGKPKYLYDVDGVPMVAKALEGLRSDLFDRIVFAVVKAHEDEYGVISTIKGIVPNAEFVILEDHTSSQSETVAETIRRAEIKGGIAIRDCDNAIEVHDMPCGNFVTGYELRYTDSLEAHANKSFILKDKSKKVVAIYEKDAVSDTISCGFYGFADASQFLEYFERSETVGEKYISAIIQAMLKDGIAFSYLQSDSFMDWGTIDDYNRYRQ